MPYNTPAAQDAPALMGIARTLTQVLVDMNACEPVAAGPYGDVARGLDNVLDALAMALLGQDAPEADRDRLAVDIRQGCLDGVDFDDAVAQARADLAAFIAALAELDELEDTDRRM